MMNILGKYCFKDDQTWQQYDKFYITSLRVPEPETSSPWAAKASTQRSPLVWTIMAASRLSQIGKFIYVYSI